MYEACSRDHRTKHRLREETPSCAVSYSLRTTATKDQRTPGLRTPPSNFSTQPLHVAAIKNFGLVSCFLSGLIAFSPEEHRSPKCIKRVVLWDRNSSSTSPTTLGSPRVIMLSLSLATLGLATIGAFAKPTIRAAGGLEVSLSTPVDKVTSVSDLRVVATVKNVGDDDLKILKFGTVLDNKLPTRSFIVNKDGKEATFTGVKVRPCSPPSPANQDPHRPFP